MKTKLLFVLMLAAPLAHAGDSDFRALKLLIDNKDRLKITQGLGELNETVAGTLIKALSQKGVSVRAKCETSDEVAASGRISTAIADGEYCEVSFDMAEGFGTTYTYEFQVQNGKPVSPVTLGLSL